MITVRRPWLVIFNATSFAFLLCSILCFILPVSSWVVLSTRPLMITLKLAVSIGIVQSLDIPFSSSVCSYHTNCPTYYISQAFSCKHMLTLKVWMKRPKLHIVYIYNTFVCCLAYSYGAFEHFYC